MRKNTVSLLNQGLSSECECYEPRRADLGNSEHAQLHTAIRPVHVFFNINLLEDCGGVTYREQTKAGRTYRSCLSLHLTASEQVLPSYPHHLLPL